MQELVSSKPGLNNCDYLARIRLFIVTLLVKGAHRLFLQSTSKQLIGHSQSKLGTTVNCSSIFFPDKISKSKLGSVFWTDIQLTIQKCEDSL